MPVTNGELKIMLQSIQKEQMDICRQIEDMRLIITGNGEPEKGILFRMRQLESKFDNINCPWQNRFEKDINKRQDSEIEKLKAKVEDKNRAKYFWNTPAFAKVVDITMKNFIRLGFVYLIGKDFVN